MIRDLLLVPIAKGLCVALAFTIALGALCALCG